MHEAAQIDGGGGWAQFRHVTLPMISPVVLFNLVMGVIGSFQVFTNAFLMTGGGPANTTLFTVLYLYQVSFEQFKLGYGSAIAWLLFLVILVFTLIIIPVSIAALQQQRIGTAGRHRCALQVLAQGEAVGLGLGQAHLVLRVCDQAGAELRIKSARSCSPACTWSRSQRRLGSAYSARAAAGV